MRNCTLCQTKVCKAGQDCAKEDNSKILKEYQLENNHKVTRNASTLIDNGRAGTLGRVDELLEFIQLQGYRYPGLAYCYGLEKEAVIFSKLLTEAGIKHSAVCCTSGALLEKELDYSKTKSTVSCNPLGQAEILKQEQCDLIIELGLCLGHDILLHRAIQGIDLTVLAVKDRKFNHCPLQGLIPN